MSEPDTIIPTTNTETSTPRQFPVFWQLGILVLLLCGMFASTLMAWLRVPGMEDSWVERTPSAQPTSLLTTSIPALNEVSILAEQAFVYDVMTGRVLYQKNPDEIVPLASITKLMTALIAEELLAGEEIVTITPTTTNQPHGSGLTAGEQLTVRALLDYSMIASANDAAYALASAVGQHVLNNGQEEVFVEIMNLRAQELELPSLRFYNATGLDETPTKNGGYGTARDISFLMAYLYREYPEILQSSTALQSQIPNSSGGYHNAQNTNRVINTIPNIIGSKTGYTDLAGGNLTIIYDAGFNRPIIITILGSTFFGRFDDMVTLIEAVTESFVQAE